MKVIRLESEFRSLIRKADEICIAVAMITDYGLAVFDDRDEECDFEILVGFDLPTQPSALQKLIDKAVEAKIYDVKNQFFHPKLYLFRIDEDWTAFLGSGNCTKGGLSSNIELSFKVEDPDAVQELLDWYQTYFDLGSTLTQKWLDEYKVFYAERSDKEKELKSITRKFKKATGVTRGSVMLSDYDFTGQFFTFKHYDAFTPPKPIEDKPGPIGERLEVRNKLEELHDLVYPLILKKGWDVYPHHQSQHLTSSFRHGERASNNLGAIWLHYGRSEEELEDYKNAYGENMTSLYHMRLEVLILKDHLWVELRVGKNDGSYPDRQYIREQLRKNPEFNEKYYDLIKKLDAPFTITIADEERSVYDFKDLGDLKEFSLLDNPKFYYFRIGRLYKPDDKAISDENIATTILNDFEKLYPLYQLFKHHI
ncbi:phospholipase D family protein [Leeuwenhoekiella aestuarii]|uniref:HKD family nuclease n=1 Tax=Leeuwenhoekiella aestuarii TaxID=2249426 RepID=A0A4Q0P152_9FLAO|nr:phospholipase D family protein [Leeuwenhoekiella aestuarii]RXG17979.1 HKD family nuclease [Leeuwenhoekiella aestuarii]